MIAIIAFHALMLALGLGILSRIVPPKLVADMLSYLLSTIGITVPPAEKARIFALVWIGATIVIVDGCLFLLVFIASTLG
ncbi:MAG: hypothetical protein WBW53_03385 [Terriglobales bacterium]